MDVLLATLLLQASTAGVEDPKELVRRLGSDELDVRDAAEEKLLLLGAGALEALGQVPPDSPPMLIERARGLHLILRRRVAILDRFRRKDPDALKELDDFKDWAMRQLERGAYAAADGKARAAEVDALARLRGVNHAQAWTHVLLRQKTFDLELKEGSTLGDFARVFEAKNGVKLAFGEGVGRDVPITVKVGAICGDSLLQIVLGPRGLRYLLTDDGGIVVRPRKP